MSKKQNLQFLISKKLMEIDISFICKDELSPELIQLSKKPMVYPYEKEDILDFLEKNNVDTKTSIEFMNLLKIYKDNYWDFERVLLEEGSKYLNKNKVEVAELCFEYLINIGSKFPIVKEQLIKIYNENNNEKKLKWIFDKIEEHLNEEQDYHQFKKKISTLKIKYGKKYFTNDQIWAGFNKRLQIKDFNEHAKIYSEMSEFLLQEKKYKDAVLFAILSYIAEAQYRYILDHSINTNSFNYYKDLDKIKNRMSSILKKTKYDSYSDNLSELILSYISQIPNAKYDELKQGLSDLLK